ncbi:hypothetical protein ACSMXM_10785 [Pacificimonas sp. ICDLI1SI03]
MIALALALAAATPNGGQVELTFDGVTTSHSAAACTTEAEGSMPSRLLVQDMDVTLNAVRSDEMQMISLIKDNQNWGATRLFNGDSWTDKGQPGEPIVQEWGETIRVEAVLTSTQADGEKNVTLVARCP